MMTTLVKKMHQRSRRNYPETNQEVFSVKPKLSDLELTKKESSTYQKNTTIKIINYVRI